jgi:hypothetical protein
VLDAIHRFPVERARAAGVSLERGKGAYHEAQEGLERELSSRLDASELACIARQRRAFEEVQPRPCAPVLLHADIKPAHLLQDPSSGALTGLLDWGDASLGHGDFDLAIVGAFCGPGTLQGVLDRLAAPRPSALGRASPSCSRSAGCRTPSTSSAGAASPASTDCTSISPRLTAPARAPMPAGCSRRGRAPRAVARAAPRRR